VPYPYFVHVPQDRLATGNAITAGLPGAVLHWASPLNIEPSKGTGRKVDVLARSSDATWLDAKTDVQPNLQGARGSQQVGVARPEKLAPDQQGAQVLAVAVTGGFPSWAVGKRKADEATGGKPPEAEAGEGGDKAGKEPLIEQSPPDARLVVIGSSAFVTDDVLQLAQQLGDDAASANVQLVQNAVDWSLADTDLLAIRARTSAARALTVPEADRGQWELINYGLAFAALGVVVLVTWLRRRSIKPLVSSEVPS
jgi:ABC-2 type transport system permease protein